MIEFTYGLQIDEKELRFESVQAGGPGGQNVNKVASAVVLRFDIAHNESLPEAVRQRLMALAGRRLTRDGELVIRSVEHRTQLQNREAALSRFQELLEEAARLPQKRLPTRVPRSVQERRLSAKKAHGEIKRLRNRPVDGDWD
ncbi:MAG: aminoacyl-tRNA hydrolase [Anaerolineae bacterium]|nr:aminoacyl-tRNA hydrolase [Anaerolineae bacterium]